MNITTVQSRSVFYDLLYFRQVLQHSWIHSCGRNSRGLNLKFFGLTQFSTEALNGVYPLVAIFISYDVISFLLTKITFLRLIKAEECIFQQVC